MSDVKFVTIDEKKYDVNSLTDKGRAIIINLQRLDVKIEQLQFEVSAFDTARSKLLEELAKEVQHFKEYVDVVQA